MGRHAMLITRCLSAPLSPLTVVDWLQLKDGKVADFLKCQDKEAEIQRPDGSKATIQWSEVDGVLKAKQAERDKTPTVEEGMDSVVLSLHGWSQRYFRLQRRN